MSPFEEFLVEVFRQHGFLGLLVFFLIVGPGFTYFRTRTIRVQTETKAQELLNSYMQQEHERAARLEARLDAASRQLSISEDEVAQLRLRLTNAQASLDEMPRLKHHIRQLISRVTELESLLREKQAQIEALERQAASSHLRPRNTSILSEQTSSDHEPNYE